MYVNTTALLDQDNTYKKKKNPVWKLSPKNEISWTTLRLCPFINSRAATISRPT